MASDTGSYQRRVFIGTTALWNVDPNFFFCMMTAKDEMMKRRQDGTAKIGSVFNFYAGEAPVGRSRNTLTSEFLKSDCTDLLFIDSDIVFSADHIERIVTHEEEVVGGIYPIKCEGKPRMCLNPKPGVFQANERGLFEVNYIGTGFLRVRRSVFEKMIVAFGEDIWYDTDNVQIAKERQYDFWRMGVYQYPDGTRRWLSEDWWFCQKCLDIGIPVYADAMTNVRHSGHITFPLSYQHHELFSKPSVEQTESAGASRMTSPFVEAPAPVLERSAA